MTRIPTNVNDLPTSRVALDEGISYTVTITQIDPIKQDKNGHDYFAAGFQIVEPVDSAGEKFFDAYIPLPDTVTPNMTPGERRQILNRAVKFSRFARCFKLAAKDGSVELDNAVGSVGQVTIKNEEYEGNIRPRVANYLI